MKFEIIHARSLALAVAADALLPDAQGMFEGYDEAEIEGLTIHESPGFEARPAARGNISRMIGQAKQECLRTLRLAFEAGDIDFEQLLELYEGVKQTAQELAWERWLAMNPDPCAYREPEAVEWEHEEGHDIYGRFERVMVRPVREHWEGYEDHGFRPIVPVGLHLGFGGVA